MDKSWIIAFFIGLIIILIILIYFQFLYIRVKLKKYEDLDAKMNEGIKSTVANNIESKSNVRIYGISIDAAITSHLNVPSSDPQNDDSIIKRLRSSYPVNIRTLPYFCDKVTPVNVAFQDFFFVAIKGTSPGAASLVSDLLNNRINYLAFREKIYYVIYDENFKEKFLNPILREMNLVSKMDTLGLSECTFIILYDMTSHKPVQQIDNSCTFEMTSFFDRVSTSNLKTYSAFSTFRDKVLVNGVVHIMGYQSY